MNNLIRQKQADIRSTLLNIGIAESAFYPYEDCTIDGKHYDGSYTDLRSWRSRKTTLKADGQLLGRDFTIHQETVGDNIDGVLIFRKA